MRTPAKINLSLHITGVRGDEYHELETCFFPIYDLFDDVIVERDPEISGIEMLSNRSDLPCDNTNLCVKALVNVCQILNIPCSGYRISLTKHIPIAAGLGGGSSDAAAVLLQMQRFYPKELSMEKLAEIAVKIGADVPFFLNPVPSIAKGVGEQLHTLSTYPVRLPLLLVAPEFPVRAKWAYQHYEPREFENPVKNTKELLSSLQKQDISGIGSCLWNDLEYSVIHKFPILQMITEKLSGTGALGTLMSGSGPTIFALYSSFSLRDKAWSEFSELHFPVRLFCV